MAAGAVDGALIVDTRIDNSGASKGSRELINLLNGLKRSIDRIGQDLKRLADGYLSTLQRASGAAEKMGETLESSASEATHAQQALRSAVAETTANIEDEYRALLRAGSAVSEAERNMEQALGINVDGGAEAEAWAEARDAAAEAGRITVEQRQAELAISEHIRSEIEATEQAYQSEIEQINQVQSAIAGVDTATQSTVQNTQEMAQTTEAAEAASGATSNLGGAFASVALHAGNALRTIGRFAGNAAVGFLKRLAAGAKNAAIQLAKLAGRAISGGLKKLGSVLGTAAKRILSFDRASRKANTGINLSLKNILKYGLGIRSLFVLFNRLRSAVKEGFEALAKENPEVQKSLSALRTSLNGLKGSLATAFSPILTTITPALTTLIDMLTRAINTIGAFMAALSGASFYYAARGADAASNAIGAVSNAASNAKDEVKDMKRQLAGFDELNILSDKSGGGGGGGGSGIGGIEFERTEIEGGITDFVAQLKQMWADADYEGIGRSIAGAINRAFAAAKDQITSGELERKVTEAIDAITGIFNGLVDEIDWTNIGSTFGEGVNTLVSGLNRLLTDIDWENLGSGFAAGLNGLVNTVDWGNLGALLAARMNAAIGTIKGAVDNIQWAQIGYAFAAGINGLFNINWDYVGSTISKSLNGALEAISVAVDGIQWAQIGYAFAAGINGIFDLNWDSVSSTITKALNGALESVSAAVDNIKWSQIGYAFAAGINGIFDLNWDSVSSTITKAMNGALEAVGSAVDGIKWAQIGYAFASGINGLFNINWDGVGSTISKSLNGALEAINTAISNIKWTQIAYDFASGLNGLVSGTNWEYLGQTAAAGIAKPLEALKTAVQTFNFGEAGIEFAKVVNGFFSNEQLWADAGTTVSDAIKGLFTWGTEFLSNIDTKQVAEDVKLALKSVDWPGIAGAIWGFLKAAFAGLGNFLIELLTSGPEPTEADQQAIVDHLLGKAPEDISRDYTVNLGLRIEFPEEQTAYFQIQEAIQEYLDNGDFNFEVPVGLDVPDGTVLAAKQEFVDRWNSLHPNVPVMLNPDTGKIEVVKNELTTNPTEMPVNAEIDDQKWQQEIDEAFGHPFDATVDPDFDWSGWDEEWKKQDKKDRSVEVITNLIKKGGNAANGIVKWAAENLGSAATFIANLTKKGSNAAGGFKKWAITGSAFGSAATFIALLKKSWKTTPQAALGLTGLTAQIKAQLVPDPAKKSVRIQTGTITGGMVYQLEKLGGIFQNGFWSSIPQYAGGTTNAHGSLFLAGEAGPEIVGHVGGRTEVLNKSQLASTMFSAVENGILAAASRIQFRMPAMATGTVMPYDVSAQIAKSTADLQGTLDANNEDLIQTIISVAGQIVAAVNGIGVNQAAQGGMNAQQIINEINRRTQMFGASPIMGV